MPTVIRVERLDSAQDAQAGGVVRLKLTYDNGDVKILPLSVAATEALVAQLRSAFQPIDVDQQGPEPRSTRT